MFLPFSNYFKGIFLPYLSRQPLNTDLTPVPFCPCFFRSDNIEDWFVFFSFYLFLFFPHWHWPSTLIAIVKGDCKKGHEASSATSSLFGCLHKNCWGKKNGSNETMHTVKSHITPTSTSCALPKSPIQQACFFLNTWEVCFSACRFVLWCLLTPRWQCYVCYFCLCFFNTIWVHFLEHFQVHNLCYGQLYVWQIYYFLIWF